MGLEQPNYAGQQRSWEEEIAENHERDANAGGAQLDLAQANEQALAASHSDEQPAADWRGAGRHQQDERPGDPKQEAKGGTQGARTQRA